jgi:hypothetical protein
VFDIEVMKQYDFKNLSAVLVAPLIVLCIQRVNYQNVLLVYLCVRCAKAMSL